MKLDRIESSAIIYSAGLIAANLLLLMNISNIKGNFVYLPNWYDSYLWINLIGKLIAVSLILNLRKIGVYLLVGLMVLEFIVGSFVVKTNYDFVIQVITGTIILLVFLYLVCWVLSPKWRLFK